MAFNTSKGGAIAQINMTPMIDLLLVMLIIFLVIAPVHPKGLSAQIPQPAPSRSVAQPESDVVVAIARDGSIKLNTHGVGRADLTARLVEIYRARIDRTIFVSGAAELEFAQVAEVIDLAKAAGADRVALITPNSSEPQPAL